MATDIAETRERKVQAEAERLEASLAAIGYGGRNGIDDRTAFEIARAIKDHRENARARGVPFPRLVPIICRLSGVVEVVPADINAEGLAHALLQIKRKSLGVVADEEVVLAAREAFPGLVAELARVQRVNGRPIGPGDVARAGAAA